MKASASVKLIFACPTLIPVELSASASSEILYLFTSISLKVPELACVKSKFKPIDCSTFNVFPAFKVEVLLS